MPESFQEKTEQPSEKRLQDARKKGQVPVSKDLISCGVFLGLTIFLYLTLSKGFKSMLTMYTGYIERTNFDINMNNVHDIFLTTLFEWAWLTVPVFLFLLIVSLAGGLFQTRLLFSFEALTPKFDKLNPIQGLKNLFTRRSLVELIKSLVKIVVLVYISYRILMQELPTMLTLSRADTAGSVYYIVNIVFWLAVKITMAFAFLAGADFLFQKWQNRKDLMMTRQEVIEEYKEREGNPLIKGRLKSLQREIARRRMMEDVKNADVIVTNPTHYAVAISYKIKEMAAPKVVAKGAGFIATKIKETAKEAGVPMIENVALAQSLYHSVKIGDFIPEQFYIVVAELLAQVYNRRPMLPKF
jgi:flagellar biosynthetic protein FlhB